MGTEISVNSKTQQQRLHIGGKQVRKGWQILNAVPAEGVDHLGDVRDLSRFHDGQFVEIYASHVLEHLSQQEILPVLSGIARTLATGGRFMVSVPDLDILCRLFISPQLGINERFHVMRMLFGGQTDSYDFHYIGFNQEFMHHYLMAAGFSKVTRVESFGLFDDTSEFKPYDVPISLNLLAVK